MGHRHRPGRALTPAGGPLLARNAEFQVLSALLVNRRTRNREGRFVVQGVVPIGTAVSRSWPLEALLVRPGPLSTWATDILGQVPAGVGRIEVAPDLLAELGGRDDGPPELVAVARHRPASPIAPGTDLVVVADRTASPGNLGSMIRSADALGAAAVVVTGYAADPYDPQAVRASRGSIFSVPVVQVASAAEALDLLRSGRPPLAVVVATEAAVTPLWAHDFRSPTAVVIGNEADGVARAWRDAADIEVAIPQLGTATSLNAAASTAIALYEAVRQRST